jgi:hypothetical protein
MMHGRKPDADFGTGFRLPVAPPKILEINRQENGRYPDPSGQKSKILRLTDFKSGQAADDCRSLQLPGGRYPLPGPDFHRLDRASFAWRTQTGSQNSRLSVAKAT